MWMKGGVFLNESNILISSDFHFDFLYEWYDDAAMIMKKRLFRLMATGMLAVVFTWVYLMRVGHVAGIREAVPGLPQVSVLHDSLQYPDREVDTLFANAGTRGGEAAISVEGCLLEMDREGILHGVLWLVDPEGRFSLAVIRDNKTQKRAVVLQDKRDGEKEDLFLRNRIYVVLGGYYRLRNGFREREAFLAWVKASLQNRLENRTVFEADEMFAYAFPYLEPDEVHVYEGNQSTLFYDCGKSSSEERARMAPEYLARMVLNRSNKSLSLIVRKKDVLQSDGFRGPGGCYEMGLFDEFPGMLKNCRFLNFFDAMIPIEDTWCPPWPPYSLPCPHWECPRAPVE